MQTNVSNSYCKIMKTVFSTILLFLVINYIALGQALTNNTSVSVSGDSAIVHVSVTFPYGTFGLCPFLQDYLVTSTGSIIKLDLYYNTTGVWVGDLCGQKDTIYLENLAQGSSYDLTIVTNKIFDTDTTFNVSQKDFTFSFVSATPAHLSEEFSLYPNPASEAVIIKFNGTTAENSEFIISDMYGRCVKRQEVTQQQEVQVPVAELPAGLYYCHVSSGGKVQVIKFVKQ